MTQPRGAGNRALAAWALYDWANSAFPTTIIYFVFAGYFAKAVAPDEVTGQAWWSFGVGLSALAVAILAPFCGAIADRDGRRKPWIAVFTIICIIATAALWTIRPDPALAIVALVLVGIANIGFEMASVFYNAMLPSLAPPHRMGRWSGWAWVVGYAGGLSVLAISLVGFVQAENPWFGLAHEEAANVRATSVLVAVWFALFALPMFFLTPDDPATGIAPSAALRQGIGQLVKTFRQVRDYRDIALFLLARVFYIDGLTTLFVVGAIFAGTAFWLSFEEIILFGIAINVFSGIGAAAFGWVDDWWGPKPTILLSIAGLTALIIALAQRRISLRSFREIFVETANTSVMLYVVLFGAMLFAKLISFSGLADALLEMVQGSGLSKMGILLAILAVFLVLGCVMDSMAIILIFVPLFTPTLLAQGFDLIWFGIVVVVLTEIGLITPPIGMNVFVLKANLPNVAVGTIFRGLIPFIAADVLRLALLVAVPGISLVLVQMMK